MSNLFPYTQYDAWKTTPPADDSDYGCGEIFTEDECLACGREKIDIDPCGICQYCHEIVSEDEMRADKGLDED